MTRPIHQFAIGPLLVLSALLAPASAAAQAPDEVFERHGLGGGEACLVFVDESAVDHRKDKWRKAIDELWATNPSAVLDWVVGAAEPPKLAQAEALKQRDCLVDLLVHDAESSETSVVIDYQREPANKATMRAVGPRYRSSASFRRQLIRLLTASEHRDARTQSWIWRRKFVFSGRTFNYVSERAGTKCGLEPRQSWKPDNHAHRDCWRSMLTPDEREREILLASAAPGISRHHWGTDIDLFSLNPARFVVGRHADEYAWMNENALLFGYFQPYTDNDIRGVRYMEERWHWSYYPIAQALTEFAASHQDEVGEALAAQWEGFEKRWRGSDPAFGYVREHWREFMFNVDTRKVVPR